MKLFKRKKQQPQTISRKTLPYPKIQPNEFKSYTSTENDEESETFASAVLAILEQLKIDVDYIGYLEAPQLYYYEINTDAENAIKIQSKVKTIEKSINIFLHTSSRCYISNGLKIEIPKQNRSLIGLGDTMSEYTNYVLPCHIGKTARGQVLKFDLCDAPHLLVAGATGAGKSVCLNSIILSLIQSRTPEELCLIMIDPKRVEFSPYAELPHLVHPIIYDTETATTVLNNVVNHMYERYDLLKAHGLRDCKGATLKSCPKIVIIIDELSSLMLQAKQETEKAIELIAALGRACGIHLIVATQSPSSKIITGRIKANIPTRIAFRTSSITDSKVILDYGGAEKLQGKGDALFLSPKDIGFTRFQNVLVTDEEIQQALSHYRI